MSCASVANTVIQCNVTDDVAAQLIVVEEPVEDSAIIRTSERKEPHAIGSTEQAKVFISTPVVRYPNTSILIIIYIIQFKSIFVYIDTPSIVSCTHQSTHPPNHPSIY